MALTGCSIAPFFAAACLGCATSPERFSHGWLDDRPLESAPTFRAQAILPPGLPHGEHFYVEPDLSVVGSRFVFAIRTEFGVLPARGKEMLAKRLHELEAIERADRVDPGALLQTAAIEALDQQSTAVRAFLSQPGGATLRPTRGFSRMAHLPGREDAWPASEPARRQIAARLGCDPETRNPVLSFMLDHLAGREDAIGHDESDDADPQAMHMPNRWLPADVLASMQSTPLHEINARIRLELRAMGIAEHLCDSLIDGGQYTTVERMLLMEALRGMEHVDGLNDLLTWLVDVDDEADVADGIRVAERLQTLQASQPIRRIVDAGWPCAVLDDGMMVAMVTADFLVDSAVLREAVSGFRVRSPESPTKFDISGDVSAAARIVLEDANVEVTTHGAVRK